MGGESSRTHDPRATRAFSDTFAAPLLLGGLLACAWYGAIAVMPQEWTFFRRYFCSHPLEYATTCLFFVAIATLMLKFVRQGVERAAFRSDLGKDLSNQDFHTSSAELQSRLDADESAHRTWLGRRIVDVTSFVEARKNGVGVEDHLRYLGELATDQLHRSYAFVRTITWAVPILGFLGTVIGITMAIANVTPEQLDSSLGEVTGGLAVAFDTTALALALSILLVFSSFLVERWEQQLLADVEDFSVRNLPRLFCAGEKEALPSTVNAPQIMASALDAFVERQMRLWEEQLGSVRERWNAALDQQSLVLTESLNEGVAVSLRSHSEEVGTARVQFEASVGKALDTAARVMSDAVGSLENRLDAWQATVRNASLTSASQLEALQEQSAALLRIAEQQGELNRLEDQLVHNLEAVRLSETFDQTLNNLTAAVHLLSARTGSRAAA